MSILRPTTRLRPSFWSRFLVVLALVAMNFLAGANFPMAGPAFAGVGIDHGHHHGQSGMALAGAKAPGDVHAAGHGAMAAQGEPAGDCPSHRHDGANDANCCAAGCLMLGMPADLPMSFETQDEVIFLLPSPQLVASASSAHLRPPRA
jgi:hypothetical protein